MDHLEVGKYWNANAEAWTKLARAGYDIYRDELNTPAFFELLPEVRGRKGLDIGCGEGHNTRLLAERGATMTALDISETFIEHARTAERGTPLGITYHQGSAVALPFPDATFDFTTSFMCFMDVPEMQKVLTESFRVIKPGGFLQFSISHPCYQTPRWEWIEDENGQRSALLCGDYFAEEQGQIAQWIFGAAPKAVKMSTPEFRIPVFYRTLSTWLNGLLDAGFLLERFVEPHADAELAERVPALADTQIVPYFLIVRCRKPIR